MAEEELLRDAVKEELLMNQDSAGVGSQEQITATRGNSHIDDCSSPNTPTQQIYTHECCCHDQRLLLQDQDLHRLLKEILSLEVEGKNQKRAIKKLLKLIPQLNGVRQCPGSQINYQEALNLALENVWLNITKFPKVFALDINNADATYVRRCFVKWFSKILQRRIFDIYRERGRQPFISLDAFPHEFPNTSTTANGIDQLAHQEWLTKLQNYLSNDPERSLQCHPKDAPQCTCQELIKRRLLREPAQKWQEIAQELKLPQGTVTAFWYRQCIPLLKEIAQKLG